MKRKCNKSMNANVQNAHKHPPILTILLSLNQCHNKPTRMNADSKRGQKKHGKQGLKTKMILPSIDT